MRKYACYCLTRNLYPKLVPALNSLLRNSDVDKVFLVIEDADPGIPIPDRSRVECINVSGQTFFGESCPNAHHKWTYMVLMRVVLSKILPPEVDTVLSLDVDTIVDADISDLWYFVSHPRWNDCYFAAVREPLKCSFWADYFNCGVVLWNLARMRDGKTDALVKRLNEHDYIFAEQDCLNEECVGQVLPISSKWNVSPFTAPTSEAKIWHFAAQPDYFETEPLVRKYMEVTQS